MHYDDHRKNPHAPGSKIGCLYGTHLGVCLTTYNSRQALTRCRTPGFSSHVDDDYNPPKTWILAQSGAYIKDFISKGFPQPSFKRWVPESQRIFKTKFQEGLNNHGAHLGDGIALIMHPKNYKVTEIGDGYEYVEGEGPEYPKGLQLLRTTVDKVMETKHRSHLNWLPDYLYLPNREDPLRTRA